ncbi:MAG TPA: four helix bundle protein [Gemmatimonadales bacterium]|nr:four helix bundle protein [Gemmatimonadales bacterium]
MGDYRKLKVWAAADTFVLEVYRATEHFPATERYGLRAQIRRSAASIPSNLAEGAGRNTDPQFQQFVRNALGSANECDYQLHLAARLGFIPGPKAQELTATARTLCRMLAALLRNFGPR